MDGINQSLGGSTSSSERRFHLAERTARLGEAMVAFAKRVPVTAVSRPIINQLVRAGTSIGANYCEADDAGSKRECTYRIGVCKRESRETMYWLRILATAVPELSEDSRQLWRETNELHLIFATIFRKTASRSYNAKRRDPK